MGLFACSPHTPIVLISRKQMYGVLAGQWGNLWRQGQPLQFSMVNGLLQGAGGPNFFINIVLDIQQNSTILNWPSKSKQFIFYWNRTCSLIYLWGNPKTISKQRKYLSTRFHTIALPFECTFRLVLISILGFPYWISLSVSRNLLDIQRNLTILYWKSRPKLHVFFFGT